ncbi:MAG: SUMF1/EgtB/PvdO family nonheme iron enzyme [Deltaproteobacteria bacterium]|nr:SUMF1/EgtB/PvdO family nonheme iron enzyme [Deltaproteobacteria bacterium]
MNSGNTREPNDPHGVHEGETPAPLERGLARAAILAAFASAILAACEAETRPIGDAAGDLLDAAEAGEFGLPDAGEDAATEEDAVTCSPQCAGRECGEDQCGGACSPGCGAGEVCTGAGHCVPSDGTWVEIPPGTFEMGSPASEPGRLGSEHQHTVTLTRGFAMFSTEVSSARFLARMGYDPFSDCGNCPVQVWTWHEAAAYCNALSSSAGRPSCYDCTGGGTEVVCESSPGFASPYDCPGYRLPTDAEWEYAARAGTTTATYNGDLEPSVAIDHTCGSPSAVLDPIAWWCFNTPTYLSHEVGLKRPNGWGLYDMLGNAEEWCNDWWQVDLGAVPSTDPTGPASGTSWVKRGGSCMSTSVGVRASYRFHFGPDSPPGTLGVTSFRPVRSLP